MSEFVVFMERTWCCVWAACDYCHNVTWRLWFFAFGAATNFLFKISTIAYVQGAVYYGVVYCISVPMGALFYSLFTDTGGTFQWSPHFDDETGFAFLGLCLIVPAIGMFYFYGSQEQKRQSYEQMKWGKWHTVCRWAHKYAIIKDLGHFWFDWFGCLDFSYTSVNHELCPPGWEGTMTIDVWSCYDITIGSKN